MMVLAAVWCLVQLLVLSAPVRVVRWSTVLVAFGVGVYACGVVSVLLEVGWARELAVRGLHRGPSELAQATWVAAPVVEELVKVAPLVVAGWVLRRRVQWGLSDFAVLGASVGTGFGLLESVLSFAERAHKSKPDDGGWVLAQSIFSNAFIPDPGRILTSLFPAPNGVSDWSEAQFPPGIHLVYGVLGGLGVGLVVCGGWWVWRVCGLVPLVAAWAAHWVNNLAAANKDAEWAKPWAEDIHQEWGIWIALGVLVGAAVVDVGRRRRGRALLPETLLAGERAVPGAGSSGGSPLLSYALIKPPYTWFIASGYARMRRALHMAAGHPRTDPARIARLREQVAERTRTIEETSDPARWRGLSQLALIREALAARARLPWHEKVFLGASLVVVLPSLAYLLVGDFKGTQGIQKWFADGAGLQVLIWAAVAGLVLVVWRLLVTLVGLRAALRLPLAEPAVSAQLRIALCAGSLLTGCLLLSRRAAIADGEKPLDVHDAVDPYNDASSFLLERFLDVGLPLLLTVATLALLAMPYALPLELMMGGGVGEMLLGAALPRLAPYLARAGVQALGRAGGPQALARAGVQALRRDAMPWA
ncbi:PrsW family intramembrane metalloprotease, partial [Streptomyces triticagri]